MTENEQPRTQCDPSISTSTFSERRSRKDEPLEDLESEITETWQKLHGYTIILQEKINESVTCLCCQGNVELVENLRTWFHLDDPVKAVCRTKLPLTPAYKPHPEFGNSNFGKKFSKEIKINQKRSLEKEVLHVHALSEFLQVSSTCQPAYNLTH